MKWALLRIVVYYKIDKQKTKSNKKFWISQKIMNVTKKIEIAGMSSSRSDDVTQFVLASVRP